MNTPATHVPSEAGRAEHIRRKCQPLHAIAGTRPADRLPGKCRQCTTAVESSVWRTAGRTECSDRRGLWALAMHGTIRAVVVPAPRHQQAPQQVVSPGVQSSAVPKVRPSSSPARSGMRSLSSDGHRAVRSSRQKSQAARFRAGGRRRSRHARGWRRLGSDGDPAVSVVWL